MIQFYLIITLVLFIANLFLTQYGYQLYTQVYKKHINFTSKPIKPSWRYLLTLLLVGGISGLLGMIIVTLLKNESINVFNQEFLFGLFVGMLVSSIAMNIRAILFYKYLERNPSQVIGGPVTLSSEATLQIALTGVVEMLIPVVAIILVVHHPFAYGFAAGMVGLILIMTLKLFAPNLA